MISNPKSSCVKVAKLSKKVEMQSDVNGTKSSRIAKTHETFWSGATGKDCRE